MFTCTLYPLLPITHAACRENSGRELAMQIMQLPPYQAQPTWKQWGVYYTGGGRGGYENQSTEHTEGWTATGARENIKKVFVMSCTSCRAPIRHV